MAEISINGHGLSTMCRLCLSRGVTLLDIFFFSTKMENQVADVIMTCAPVQISKRDEMPDLICQLCYTQVEKIYAFQTQVVQSDKRLRRYLKQLGRPAKQTKTECSQENSSINETNSDITVKRESKELHDVIDNMTGPMNGNCSLSAKCVDDTLSKNDCAEDRIIDSGDIKLEEDANDFCSEKETEKIDSADRFNDELTLKSELQTGNLLIQLGYINDSESTSSNCEGSDPISEDFDHKSENFANLPSGVVKHNKREKKKENSTKNKSGIKRTYQCEFCGKCCTHSHHLKRHKRVHTGEKPYRCDICNSRFSLIETLKSHQAVHTHERRYQCELCKKTFLYKTGLKYHIRSHTGVKPYQCDICDKSFAQSTHLKNHKRTHTGAKPLQCPVCDKRFSVWGSLRNHQSVHITEKPFQCDICMKGFTIQRYLNNHKLIHSGEKPYRCDVCDKRYSSASSLKIHNRKHSDVLPYQRDDAKQRLNGSVTRKLQHNDKKPHKCGVCGKCFTTAYHLKVHARTHTDEKPYQCDICKRCFNQLSNLNYHKLTHTGEKPYQCDVCDKGFTLSRNLNIHKRTHTGEKPYQCDICKKRFTVLTSLVVHKCLEIKDTGVTPCQ